MYPLSADRLSQFGDGHFTTIKVVDGQPIYLSQHIQRLNHANQRLNIGDLDMEILKLDIQRAAKELELGVLKIVVSRGKSERGYAVPNEIQPIVYYKTGSLPSHYDRWREEGVVLDLGEYRLSNNRQLAGVKHCNRLDQVMCAQELAASDCDELIFLDQQANVVETSCANLYVLIDGKWLTPELDEAGVNGILRQRFARKSCRTAKHKSQGK